MQATVVLRILLGLVVLVAPIAANNRTLIFQIGMNMMGTGSLWRWLISMGIPSLHWGGLLANGTRWSIALKMAKNSQENRPLLEGLLLNLPALGSNDTGVYAAFLDMELLENEGLYMIEAYKYFRELDEELGASARFVLTIRSDTPWVRSRFAFGTAWDRGMNEHADDQMPGGDYWLRWARAKNIAAEPCTVAAAMLEEKHKHEAAVREYFADESRRSRFIEIDVTEDERTNGSSALCAYLEIDRSRCKPFPHINDRSTTAAAGATAIEVTAVSLPKVLNNCVGLGL